MNRLLIAGTSSGSGKTTISCAILSALKKRGINPRSFKCGPDYIDPIFHRTITGIKAYNLDPFFLDGKGLRAHLAKYAKDFSLIEGAMGYYDGISNSDKASAYTVAKETNTPVVLVVSAKGIGPSLVPILEGFLKHKKDSQIKGVIFNHASKSRYPDLQELAKLAGIRAYGYFPYDEKIVLPSRHLGLMQADEINDLHDKLDLLGHMAKECIDIDGLLDLAKTAPILTKEEYVIESINGDIYKDIEDIEGKSTIYNKKRDNNLLKINLAIAKDSVFSFYYEENLELLEELGCNLTYFSPLKDKALPENIQGLYIGGGYPELYTKELSANLSMLKSIKEKVDEGLPLIAEAGGFLYLHETLDDYPMCKVIEGKSFKTDKLQRFGYFTLTAQEDNMLCSKDESINVHEFHYWDSTNYGSSFIARKPGRNREHLTIHANKTMYAGFPHIYFLANPKFAKNFVERMKEYER